VDKKVKDLTRAGEISRDLLQNCQNKINEVRGDVRDVSSVNATNRQLQGEIGQTLRKLNADMRSTAPRQAPASAAAPASLVSSEELLKQLAVSVIDIKKMVGASSQDVAALSRKVEGMESRLNKSQLHADTFSLLQKDMLAGHKHRKAHS
jgi:aconitase B